MSAELHLPDCIHCGLCLTACPTYLVTGLEAESPRGRLMFIDSLLTGDTPHTPRSSSMAWSHLDTCLDCRACATACPSGVDYPGILDDIRMKQAISAPPSRMKKFLLNALVSRGFRNISQIMIRVAQITGMIRVLAKLLPILKGFPSINTRSYSSANPEVLSAIGERKGTVALFTGCVMDNFYSTVHESTVRLLRWNGFDVQIPKHQTCCGALHHHNGLRREVAGLARKNIDAFHQADIVIVNAAGCGAELKEYPDRQFTQKVMDITEFLDSIDLKEFHHTTSASSMKVIWDAPCHLAHGQKIHDAPHRLLERSGLKEIPFPQSQLCCGSAGSYMVTQPESAEAILKMKIEDIKRTGCDVIITANPGCQMHIQKGLVQFTQSQKVTHICEILDEVYQINPEYKNNFNKG